MKKVTKAVIPCAGFGTRFLPVTKSVPKEMLPIIDVPALQLIVEEAVNSGIKEILIILGKNKKCIEDHFDISVELEQLLAKNNKHTTIKAIREISDMAHFTYVRQKQMDGSGRAILEAEAFVGNDPFAVIYGDDIVYNAKGELPAIGQLIEAYYTTGKSILGAQTVAPEEAIKYGVVYPGHIKGRYTEMKGIVEKPKIQDLPSNLASLGRYVLTPSIFDEIRRTAPQKNGEVYLTDAINSLAKSEGVYAYDFVGNRYDTGDKFGYLQANIEYGLRHNEIGMELKEYLKELVKNL